MTDLGLNFEDLRISTFRKAIKVSKSVESLKNSTVNSNIELQQNTFNTDDNPKKPCDESNIISKSSRADVKFSIKKMLLENERQRQAKVRLALDKHKEAMEKFNNHFHQQVAELKHLQAAKRERELLDECRRIEKENELAQQEEIELGQKMKLIQHRCEEKRKSVLLKLEREAEELLRVQQQKVEPLRLSFHDTCQDIAAVIEISKDKNSLREILLQHTERLKGFHQDMEAICEIARCGELNDNDVKTAEDIVRQSLQVLDFCKAEVMKINNQYDKEVAKRQLDLQLAQEQVQQHVEENPPDVDALKYQQPVEEAFILQNQSTTRATEKDFIDNYIESFKDFQQSVELKKFRSEVKKEICTLCNQLNSNAPNTCKKLLTIFRGHGKNNIYQHPQSSEFFKFTLVESIFKNAKKGHLVDRPSDAAFVGNFIIDLWTEFPDIGKLLLSYFRVNFPLIIPEFHQEFQDLDYENMVYITGMTLFYAAIISCDKKPHPHGPENAWRWLATILNAEIQVEYREVTAMVIRKMMEAVGSTLWRLYPKQFPKLLSFIVHQYCPINKKQDVPSPKLSMLLTFAENSLEQQRISQ